MLLSAIATFAQEDATSTTETKAVAIPQQYTVTPVVAKEKAKPRDIIKKAKKLLDKKLKQTG